MTFTNKVVLKVQETGKSTPQILAILVACLAPITNGILFSWSSPFIVQITKDKENYDISEDEASYFAYIPAIAMTLTGFLFAKLSDFMGRKRTLLIGAIPHIISWTLIAVAKSVYVFYVARIFSGIADACTFSSVPMYIGEISTPKVRGTWGNSMAIALFLGGFIVNVMGNYFSVKQTAYICVALPVIFVSLFAFMPESPYYYVMKQRHDDAKNSLRRLRGKQDIEEDFLELKTDVERQISESGTWKDLFTINSNRKALIAGIFLRASQQMGGLSAFSVYTQYVFEKAGGNLSSGTSSMIYSGLCFTLMTAAGFVVDKLGRRKAFTVSLILCTIILYSEAVYFFVDQQHPEINLSSINWMPIAGMFLYIIFSSLGLGTIPTLMLGELFSTSIKAKGLTVMSLMFALFHFLASHLFYVLTSNVGFYSPFLFFGICTSMASILASFLVPETKGKTLEQIQQSLKKTKNTSGTNNIQFM